MHTTRLVTVAALVSATALILTGCSSSKESVSSDELGPISKKMQEIYENMDSGDVDTQNAKYEEAIAACMKVEGFEYIPVDYIDESGDSDGSDVPEWGTLEFAKEFGYGISTQQALAEAYGVMEEEAFENPNAEYISSLSEEQVLAYNEALYGNMMYAEEETIGEGAEGEETTGAEYDWTTAGCSGKAQHDVFGELPGGEESSVESDYYALQEKAAEDSRIAETEAEWVSCMTDEGYNYDNAEGPEEDFSQQVSAFYDEEGNVDEEGIKGLQKGEIDTAVADFNCAEKSGLATIQTTVLRELEEEYYAEHKAEVDKWLASMEDLSQG